MTTTVGSTTPTPVSTSCAYESWNTTTGCWNYRPCAQCLQTTGCMISHMGFCQEIGLARSQHSFTRAFALNLTLPAAKDTMNESMRRIDQEWEFPAGEATYCARDDAVCSTCVQEAFWNRGFRDDSRFCVGANGCVCVMNCEFTRTWNPACGAQYVGETTLVLPTPVPSSVGPTPTPITPVTPGTDDACRYISGNGSATGCVTYRSCRDCLDKAGCRIAIDGYCEAEDLSASSKRYDYHIALRSGMSLPDAREKNATSLLGLQHWQFPGSQLDYCPTNDTTCNECTKQNYWLSVGAPDDSRFCVGSNNCVCVSNCARDDSWTHCPRAAGSETESSWDGVARALTWIAVVCIVFAILLVCACTYCCYQCQKRRRRRQGAIPVARVVGSAATVTTAADGEHGPAMYVLVEPASSPFHAHS